MFFTLLNVFAWLLVIGIALAILTLVVVGAVKTVGAIGAVVLVILYGLMRTAAFPALVAHRLVRKARGGPLNAPVGWWQAMPTTQEVSERLGLGDKSSVSTTEDQVRRVGRPETHHKVGDSFGIMVQLKPRPSDLWVPETLTGNFRKFW